MPLICSICRHPNRLEIEKELIGKVPLRHIATQFGTSTGSLRRHQPHITKALLKTHATVEIRRTRTVFEEVLKGHERAERLLAACEQMFQDASKSGDTRGALAALKAAREAMAEIRQHVALRSQFERERSAEIEVSGESAAQQLLDRLREIVANAAPEPDVVTRGTPETND